MVKKIYKDIGHLVAGGATIGVGTMIATKAGATSVLPALGTAGRMLGPVTTATIGLRTLKIVKHIKPMKQKRIRY